MTSPTIPHPVDIPDGTKLETVLEFDPAQADDGSMVVCTVSCEQLGLFGAQLVIEPATNREGLRAPCGCMASVQLSGLMVGLAGMLLQGEHAVDGRTPPGPDQLCGHWHAQVPDDEVDQSGPAQAKPKPRPITSAADLVAEPLPPGLVKH